MIYSLDPPGSCAPIWIDPTTGGHPGFLAIRIVARPGFEFTRATCGENLTLAIEVLERRHPLHLWTSAIRTQYK